MPRVIDLFAGPGGLSEGFSSLIDEQGERIFNICLSIEKDFFAHQTLKLRSFLRQFPINQLPEDYYRFLRRDLSLNDLYQNHPEQYDPANNEAILAELGVTEQRFINEKIENALEGEHDWVLIGGPPCQAYSVVGRSRSGGINPEDNRVFLYREYLRIIADYQPAVFVMENVKGILSAQVNDYSIFDRIIEDLTRPREAINRNNLQNLGYTIFSFVVWRFR